MNLIDLKEIPRDYLNETLNVLAKLSCEVSTIRMWVTISESANTGIIAWSGSGNTIWWNVLTAVNNNSSAGRLLHHIQKHYGGNTRLQELITKLTGATSVTNKTTESIDNRVNPFGTQKQSIMDNLTPLKEILISIYKRIFTEQPTHTLLDKALILYRQISDYEMKKAFSTEAVFDKGLVNYNNLVTNIETFQQEAETSTVLDVTANLNKVSTLLSNEMTIDNIKQATNLMIVIDSSNLMEYKSILDGLKEDSAQLMLPMYRKTLLFNMNMLAGR